MLLRGLGHHCALEVRENLGNMTSRETLLHLRGFLVLEGDTDQVILCFNRNCVVGQNM